MTKENIETYLPILISLVALGISWYVAYLSRQSFITSQRPFIWALNRNIINSNNLLVPIPQEVAFNIKNAPAKIQEVEIIVFLEDDILISEQVLGQIRFPDEGSQWGFILSNEQFDTLIGRDLEQQKKLKRKVSIKYTSLDGSGNYSFVLIQKFIPEIHDWSEVSQSAN